ncbi:c-type cytochrome biogenesis protein CcsB [Marinilabiliaceae bacterium ANBcel2]|nr:c-type cytochrome biogenesis protein CcsB [Marinilabiliaceae bacterium ANBcel2]
MKTLSRILSGYWLMGALFILLAASMALATFIENDYGTHAAKALVYNTIWFEFLFVLLGVNMLLNLFKHRTWQKGRTAVFIFHISFIVILIGAAITRYSGYEGLLHIREGHSANVLLSSDPYIKATYINKGDTATNEKISYVCSAKPNEYRARLKAGENRIKIRSRKFVPNAVMRPVRGDSSELTPISHPGENNHLPNAVVFEIDKNGESYYTITKGRSGELGKPSQLDLNNGILEISYGAKEIKLPFNIKLNKFTLERYPGSQSPSGYRSDITLKDSEREVEKDYKIFMNNVLNYRGYRFFQSSYDQDEKGTVLSVNKDLPGTVVTYIGYFLMIFSMLWALIAKNTRFRFLINKAGALHNKRKKLTTLLLFAILTPAFSVSDKAIPDKEIAKEFGSIAVQGRDGRIKPLNSLHQEIALKLVKHITFEGMSADQMVLGMFTHPHEWQKKPIITVKDPKLRSILGITSDKASFSNFFDSPTHYKIHGYVDAAHRQNPAQRDKFEDELIKVDEQVNVFYTVQSGHLHRIFPSGELKTEPWYTPVRDAKTLSQKDSLFAASALQDLFKAVRSNEKREAFNIIDEIKNFQRENGGKIMPSTLTIELELLYNRLAIFMWLAMFYFIIGSILVFLQFTSLIKPSIKTEKVMKGGYFIVLAGFLYYSAGLVLRWIIAGHAPWSNGYESMIFTGWCIILAAFLMERKSSMVIPIASLFTGVVLMVAHLSWMNPQITNLVPVLQSHWLTLHVSVIIIGYGFFALGALLGFLSLIICIFRTKKSRERLNLTIGELTSINEMSLTAGLYLMTIGSFLGGIWANESWGRYWGWDPKETWSLITIILYAFILHMRFIPGLKGNIAFNTGSIITFGSVIMTYLGVNYYLAGLHSYAGGDPVPIPNFIYYSVAIIFVVIIAARWNEAQK